VGGADGEPPTVAERAALGMPPVVEVVVAIGGVVVGWLVVHASSSAGEIMPAPITTERATSLSGERPRYDIIQWYAGLCGCHKPRGATLPT
jgi:hypothetical protein